MEEHFPTLGNSQPQFALYAREHCHARLWEGSVKSVVVSYSRVFRKSSLECRLERLPNSKISRRLCSRNEKY